VALVALAQNPPLEEHINQLRTNGVPLLGANGDELYVATLDDCYAIDGRAEMLAGEERD
jgi:hypothetical protein